MGIFDDIMGILDDDKKILDDKAVKETRNKIEQLFGMPLSKETLESGFLESLNPLRISLDSVSSSKFSIEKLTNEIINDIPGFKCKYSYNSGIFFLFIFEEGFVVKYKNEFYYKQFSDVSLSVKQNTKIDDFDYSVEDPIHVLRLFLKSNYRYYYRERGTNTIVEYSNYAKLKNDGTLDKRYSKQNNSSSIYRTTSSVNFDEKLMLDVYSCRIDGDFLEYSTDKLDEFCNFAACIYNSLDKDLSNEIISCDNKGVPLLSDDDRSKIKACLNKDYKAEIKVDEEKIRAEYDLSDWEHLGEGRYRKVTIVNGVEYTSTKNLSIIINGVARPMNKCEIEKEIADDIKKAKNAYVKLKKESAKKLLDEIIKLRRFELEEKSSNESIVSMIFGDFAKSKGIDLNKFKKDKPKVAINVVRKSIEDLRKEKTSVPQKNEIANSEKIEKREKREKRKKREMRKIVIIYIIIIIILFILFG